MSENAPRQIRSAHVRRQAAELASSRGHAEHHSNGDEARQRDAANRPTYTGNFTKCLPHDADGFVLDPADYEEWVRAVDSADPGDFEGLRIGPGPFENDGSPVYVGPGEPKLDWSASYPPGQEPDVRGWESPGAGSTFDLQGPDAQAVTLPPAPSLDSQELIAEMGEVYWMALCRDVPFASWGADPVSQRERLGSRARRRSGGLRQHPRRPASPPGHGEELSRGLEGVSGRAERSGHPRAGELRTGLPAHNNAAGSRHLCALRRPLRGLSERLPDPARSGSPSRPRSAVPATGRRRQAARLRPVRRSAHPEPPVRRGYPGPQGGPLPEVQPPPAAPPGGARRLDVQTTRRQTRRARPARRPDQHGGGFRRLLRPRRRARRGQRHRQLATADGLHGGVTDPPGLRCGSRHGRRRVRDDPEGLVRHRLGPRDGDEQIAYEPAADGSGLVDVSPTTPPLTLEGELNKLASNIAVGRNWSGMHYFSDEYESLRLGEKIAVGILEEQKLTYGETFSMTVPLFDGTTVRI